ncbi:MAG: hypothetical protein U0V70_10355 [Terriglobia bacterium]
MQAKDRRDYRENEDFSVQVSGTDVTGHSFVEESQTIDISSVGVSFRLKNSISPRSFVGIDWSGKSQLFAAIVERFLR